MDDLRGRGEVRTAASAGSSDGAPRAGWAHASGWAQLGGERRHLSCVLPLAGLPRPGLPQALANLSDTLTEAGYPWELLMLAHDVHEAVLHQARRWCELPGFQLLRMEDGQSAASRLHHAVKHARGDLVLLLHPQGLQETQSLARLVLAWEAGAQLAFAQADTASPMHTWRLDDPALTPHGMRQLLLSCTHHALFDRRVLRLLRAG